MGKFIISRRERTREILFAAALLAAGEGVAANPWAARGGVAARLDRLPVIFEPNRGQAEAGVDFLTRGRNYGARISAQEVNIPLASPSRSGQSALRVTFVGANAEARPQGSDPLPGRSSYFLGNDPSRWQRDVPHYATVEYREVYPGIDLVYYSNSQRELEYDFRVAAGAGPEQIRLAFAGADGVEIDAEGDLLVTMGERRIRQKRPAVHQESDAGKEAVAGSYVLLGENQVGFELGSYDRSRAVVIDPVLEYAAYFGVALDEKWASVVVDAAGNSYVAGTLGGAQVGLLKINPNGSGLGYFMMFGGGGQEITSCHGSAIAVDASGNVYITGHTNSANFPATPGAYDTQINGGDDFFAVKINPDGNAILYATLLGGSAADTEACVAVDAAGDIYITGETASANFPTTDGAFDRSLNGAGDVIVAKIRPAGQGGSDLLYSTFLGCDCTEVEASHVVDAEGKIYVVGETGQPPNFPTTPGAYRQTHSGGIDVFAVRINPRGQGQQDLEYSTFLGGSGTDARNGSGKGVALGRDGAVYVIGETDSTDFPTTPGAYSRTHHGQDELFIVELNMAGRGEQDLVFSTFVGGSGADEHGGIVVDEANLIYFAGDTDSTNFPVVGPLQANYGGGNSDVVVGILSPDGSSLLYSSYLGAGGFDCCPDLFVDNLGALHVVSETSSNNLPATPGAFDTTYGGAADLFIAKFGSLGVRMFTVSNASGRRPEQAPESIVSGFGLNLADQTVGATQLPLPATLANVLARVIDSQGTARQAPLFFVSPTQINYVVPAGTALGWAQVEVVKSGQVVARDGILIRAAAPAIYTANLNGSGVPLANFLRANADGSVTEGLVYNENQPVGQRTPAALNLGGANDQFYLILFGTGLRGAANVTSTVGGQNVGVAGPVALQQFVGLDQVNLGPMPRANLMGRGNVDVILTINGVASNTVTVNFQ